jgi:hypothetical protein
VTATLPEIKLRRLLARIGRIPKLEDYAEDRWSPLQIWVAEGRAKRALFVTKIGGLMGVDLNKLPKSTTLLAHYRVCMPALCERIARECPSGRLDFVGDLDPLDLTVYLTLASRLKKHGVTVRHVGVNGAWVERARKHLATPWKLPTIPMSGPERKHYALLKSFRFDWEAVIGAEAVALLDSGEKLELEGATNPAFYRGRALSRAIERALWGS